MPQQMSCSHAQDKNSMLEMEYTRLSISFESRHLGGTGAQHASVPVQLIGDKESDKLDPAPSGRDDTPQHAQEPEAGMPPEYRERVEEKGGDEYEPASRPPREVSSETADSTGIGPAFHVIANARAR